MVKKYGIFMKQMSIVLIVLGALVARVHAQDQIYRCGNEYTNTQPDARTKGCRLVESGNVTVVQGTRVFKAVKQSAASASSSPRLDVGQQKSRDSDARLILQTELQKAQARQEELKREYNDGSPEKRGEEARNYQKYKDRVAEIKASMVRNESDIAGIQRELNRLGTPTK